MDRLKCREMCYFIQFRDFLLCQWLSERSWTSAINSWRTGKVHDNAIVLKTLGNGQQRVRTTEQGTRQGTLCLSVLTGKFPAQKARVSHTLEKLLVWTICSSMERQRSWGQQTPRISRIELNRVKTGKEQNEWQQEWMNYSKATALCKGLPVNPQPKAT